MIMQVVSHIRGPAKGHRWVLKPSLPSGYQARCPGMWLLQPWKSCNFLVGLPTFLNLHKCTVHSSCGLKGMYKVWDERNQDYCEVQSVAIVVVTPNNW